MTQHSIMQKVDLTLLRTRVGEMIAISFGGGSALLESLGWITPIIGLAGAVLGLVAGWYTVRLKRAEFLRHRDKWNHTKIR